MTVNWNNFLHHSIKQKSKEDHYYFSKLFEKKVKTKTDIS